MSFFSPSTDVVEGVRSLLGNEIIESENDLMNFINLVCLSPLRARMTEMPRVLLRAKAQQQLFKFFWMRVRSLRAGSLNGHGLPGRTIVGAKGIGKTQAAEAFVNVVESILPDVIGVYVDMKTPAGTHLATGTFLNGLEAHLLSARSLSVSKRDMLKSPEVQLMKALRDNNKYLFLFVDELDEFYRNDPKDNHVATIQELAALGESSSGRVTTVLCGSSAYLGDLIRRRTTESIKIRFNLTTGGIVDLNGSKYRTTRIDSNLPTDLDCVVAIFRAQVSDFPVEEVDPETMGNVRQVAFEAGAIVRDVQSQIELEQGGGAASLRGISQSITTVRPLNAVETALYNGFLEATANKNRRLFNELMQGERETEMIRTIPWETRFEPLNWAELEALWISIDGETKAIECSKAGGLDRVPKSTLEETLLDLADHSWVVIGEVADGRPKNVYPLAMSSRSLHSTRRLVAREDHLSVIVTYTNCATLLDFGSCERDPQVSTRDHWIQNFLPEMT